MHRTIHKAAEWYSGAQQRAQRRKSPWNLILLLLGLIAVGAAWSGFFRVVWACHHWLYPQHELHDFWGSGISFRSFVPSFLMLFALAPGALCTGLAIANCIAWLIQPARNAFNTESSGRAGTGFRESTRVLLLCAGYSVAAGFFIALIAAWSLTSLI